MAVLAWDMVIERSPPRLAAPLSGARLECDLWSAKVLNPGVDRGRRHSRQGLQLAERTSSPPSARGTRPLNGWLSRRLHQHQWPIRRHTMCMQHLTHIDSIVKRCGTKIMAQTRLLSVTSNSTYVFGLNALMRQHSDCGGPKTVVGINCAQFSSQWNLSHHAVQCVDTNWVVFVPHPRLLETRTRPLPKVITGRVQLGHVLFKWRHRASTILFKHQLIFLTVMLGIILMILG